MRRLLEMLKAATDLVGEEIFLAQLVDEEGVADRITLDELNRLQGHIGDLHQMCRTLLEKIKYSEVKE